MYMMKTAQRFLLIALVMTGLGLHTQAQAQSANARPETAAIVMIVDFEGIMREASAMQDMRKQVEKRRDSYQSEIEKRPMLPRNGKQRWFFIKARSFCTPMRWMRPKRSLRRSMLPFRL